MRTIIFFVLIFCLASLSAWAQMPIFPGVLNSIGTPATPIDSNSGGGCTGSSGAWTCTGAATITITDATAATIFYTTSGTAPNCIGTSGTLYTAPFTSPGSTFTLKAIGCNGITAGAVLTSVYTISGGSPTLISHVQGPATPASGGGAATAINTTGANLIVVVISNYATQTVTDSVTGCSSPCNTWTALTSYTAGQPGVRTYYAQNATVGTNHIITVTGAASYVSFCVLAFSNMKTSGVFNAGTDSGAANSGATAQPGSITPPSGHQVVITGLAISATTTLSVDSGFTISDQFAYDSSLGWGIGAAYLIQTTGATVNPTWSWSAGTFAQSNIASFGGM